jgi:hypothetical protein
MRRTLIAFLAAGIASVSWGPAYAQHSFVATYFVDQEITVEGTLTQFLYRNPHSFVKVEAADKDGQLPI